MLIDFANDMSGPELLTISSTSNSSKGNRTPDVWIPNNTGMTCAYVKIWVAVKYDWNLGVATAEKTFLQNTLNAC